jgi:TnpA family transposase
MSILSITANAAKAELKDKSRRGKWEKPDIRQTKVNVDGSFHQDFACRFGGAVVHDQEGNFIAASSIFLSNIASAAASEAMAMREGFALAHRLGCNNVIMESDSLETVEACNGDEA